MRIPDHLTCHLRNLYAGQEATIRTRHGTTDWFQIGKRVHQGCTLSARLFNLYAEYIMQNARQHEAQAGIKIAGYTGTSNTLWAKLHDFKHWSVLSTTVYSCELCTLHKNIHPRRQERMAFNLYRGALWTDSKNLPIIAILQKCLVALPSLVCWVHPDLPSESLHPDEDLIELDHQHRASAHASPISSLAPWEGQSLWQCLHFYCVSCCFLPVWSLVD